LNETQKKQFCQSCGSLQSFHPFFKDTLKCGNCNSWSYFGDTSSTYQIYEESYFQGAEYNDYLGDKAIHDINFNRKIQIIEGFLKQIPKQVIELGCAYGFFLEACKQRFQSASLVGFDVSKEGITRVNSLGFRGEAITDKNPIPSNLSELNISQTAPLVCFWDTFEHVPKPFEMLQTISGWQSKGDLISFSTVDTSSWVAQFRKQNWRQFHPPSHLHYPTREGLKLALERLNYSVVYHKSFGYYRSLEQYLPFLGKLLPRLLPKPLSSKLLKLPLYLNLFDTQMIVARKN
jgi:ribosomal protein S27AE